MSNRQRGESLRSDPLRPASFRAIALTFLAPLLLLAIVSYVAHLKHVNIGLLLHDPSALALLPFYAGFITKVGIMIWVITAAVNLFSYSVLPESVRKSDAGRYLLASGALSLMLGLDDSFQVHEVIAPHLFGIPEVVVLGTYALLSAWILIRARGTVWAAWDGLLAGAVACFIGSIVVDQLLQQSATEMIEESFKFVGINLWGAFHLRLALTLVRRLTRATAPS